MRTGEPVEACDSIGCVPRLRSLSGCRATAPVAGRDAWRFALVRGSFRFCRDGDALRASVILSEPGRVEGPSGSRQRTLAVHRTPSCRKWMILSGGAPAAQRLRLFFCRPITPTTTVSIHKKGAVSPGRARAPTHRETSPASLGGRASPSTWKMPRMGIATQSGRLFSS